MTLNWSEIIEKVVIGVTGAFVLALLGYVWNFASSGWLLDIIVRHSAPYQALQSRLSTVEQKLSGVSVNTKNFHLQVGDASYDFPANGNMNIRFAPNYFCFAANDKNRPNENDRRRCFFELD